MPTVPPLFRSFQRLLLSLPPRRALGAIALCIALLSTRIGFTDGLAATTGGAATSPPSDPVHLSVFEVSEMRDTGYQASSTLSGTRTGELLKNVPVSITVLTPELMQDLGARTFVEAAEFAPGIQAEGNAYSENNTINRGIRSSTISGSGGLTRDFFVTAAPMDLYNVERIEVIRGPNSVLYGEADPGGLSNAMPKRASGSNETRIEGRYGPGDNVRVTLDTDRRLAKSLFGRLNVLFQDGDGWRNWEKQRQQAIDGTLTWRPFAATAIRAEYEYSAIDRVRALPILIDGFSAWNGTPIPPNSANAGATSFAATGTQAVPANVNVPRQTWIEGQIYNMSSLALRNYRQSSLALSTGLPVFDRELGSNYGSGGGAPTIGPAFAGSYAGREIAPQKETWVGPNAFEDSRWSTANLSIEHRLCDLSLSLVGNTQIVRNNRLRPSNNTDIALLDPNTLFPGNGRSYLGEFYVDLLYIDSHVITTLNDARATAVYDLDLGFTQQRLIGTGAYRSQFFRSQNFEETVLPGTPGFVGTLTTQNMVYRRYYFWEGNSNPSTFGAPTVPGVTEWLLFNYAQYSKQYDRSLSGAALGQYLKGRLRSTLGYRVDFFRDQRVPQGAGDPVTGVRRLDFGSATSQHVRRPTVNAGAVFFLTPQWSVYANYSESFRLATANALIDDTVAPPRLGNGTDVGVRFDLFESRVTGGLTAYDIEFTNNNVTPPVTTNVALRNLLRGLDPTSTVGTSSTSDTVATRSRGLEFELTANVTSNFRLSANYSHTRPTDTSLLPRIRGYYESIQSNSSRIPAATYAANFPTLDAFIKSQVEGGITPGTRRDLFNAIARYDFTTSILKGAFVSGMAAWRSSSVFDGTRGLGSLPAYTVFHSTVGYRFRRGKVPVSASLQVRNVTDEAYITGNNSNFFTYGSPRDYTLTVSTRF